MSRFTARWSPVSVATVLGTALVGALLFLPTVGFEFTNWDDVEYVVENPILVSGELSRLLDPGSTTVYGWTPIAIGSFALERAAFGLEPTGYHATNLLLHGGCTALVGALLLGSGVPAWGALIGATLFAVHPLQVESVAWVSSRRTLLSSLFLLAALLAFRGRGRRSPALGTTLGALALLAKPTAVVLVPLALLDRLRTEPRSWAQACRDLAPLALGALVIGLLAMHHQAEARSQIAAEPVLVRLLTMATVTGTYVRNLVDPTELSAAYLVTPARADDLTAIAVLGALVIGVGAGAWFLRRNRLALFWLAWIPLAGFPHANLIAGPYWMADRYTYLPLVGVGGLLGMGAAALLARGPRAARVGVALVAATLLGACAWQCVKRQEVWRSSIALWEDTLRKAPEFGPGHGNLGAALASEGRFAEAAQSYARALQLQPGDVGALASLANMHYEMGQTAEALALYRAALAADPRSFHAHYNLALVLEKTGQPARAVEHYARALEVDPESWTAWNNLGNAQKKLGRDKAAMEAYRHALKVNPSYTLALVNLGNTLRRLGQLDEAEEVLGRAVALDPTLVEAQYGLAVVAAARGDLRSAHERLVLVLQLDPDLEVARRSLARVREELAALEQRP